MGRDCGAAGVGRNEERVVTNEAPVRIVVFDLGGVLVRIVRSWGEAHAAAGLAPHPIVESVAFNAARAELAHAHQVGAMAPAAYFRAVAAASEGAYSAGDVESILEAWQSAEYPGVDEVVGEIERAGRATGALSNTNPVHWASLRPVAGTLSGGAPRFPTVARLEHAHASHLLRLAKPDPTIYRAFERETRFAAGDVLFFDDLEENVAVARSVGWRAEVIDHSGDTAAQLRGWLRDYGVVG